MTAAKKTPPAPKQQAGVAGSELVIMMAKEQHLAPAGFRTSVHLHGPPARRAEEGHSGRNQFGRPVVAAAVHDEDLYRVGRIVPPGGGDAGLDVLSFIQRGDDDGD